MELRIHLKDGVWERWTHLTGNALFKSETERLDIFDRKRETGRVVVSAKLCKDVFAGMNGFEHIDAVDTSGGALGVPVCFREHHGWTVKTVHQATGYNANHSHVPIGLVEDDCVPVRRKKKPLSHLHGFIEGVLIQHSAFPVQSFQLSRTSNRFHFICGHKQGNGSSSISQSSCGINPWPQTKNDGGDRAIAQTGSRLLCQTADAHPWIGSQSQDSLSQKDAIFSGNRNDIGGGSECDQVQVRNRIKSVPTESRQ